MKKKQEVALEVYLTIKEINAIIKALRYDLEENGYSYLKDNLIINLRTYNGDITFLKNGDMQIKQEILRKPVLGKQTKPGVGSVKKKTKQA